MEAPPSGHSPGGALDFCGSRRPALVPSCCVLCVWIFFSKKLKNPKKQTNKQTKQNTKPVPRFRFSVCAVVDCVLFRELPVSGNDASSPLAVSSISSLIK